jgi:cytochrome c oxidase subunit 2
VSGSSSSSPARDVIHSFWVPAFLQKLDMIPGRVNRFQVTPTQEGTFKGKCAELCGAYHSNMLFNVKVVSRAEYDKHMADLGLRARPACSTTRSAAAN